MDIFVLHGNEPEMEEQLDRLKVPHGTALPSGEFGGRVIVWGKQKAEAVFTAMNRQTKAPKVNPDAVNSALERGAVSQSLAIDEPPLQVEAVMPMKVTGLWSSARPSKAAGGTRKMRRTSGGKPEDTHPSGAIAAKDPPSQPPNMKNSETLYEQGSRLVLDKVSSGAASASTEYSTITSRVTAGASSGSAKGRPAGHWAYGGFLSLPILPKDPIHRLRTHGIEVDDRTFGGGSEKKLLAQEDVLREYPYVYRVPVFHLEALTLFRQQRDALLLARLPGQRPGEFEEVGLAEPTYLSQRAVHEAVKALYVLGLDYGEAVIGIRPAGRPAVLDAWAQPDARLGALYAEAIGSFATSYARKRERSVPAMLGTDPEFLLVNPAGKVVAASRYLERDGEAGCDAIVRRGHRVIMPLAELRPRPSTEPRKLAANLRGAMRLAASRISDASLVWLAGGMPLRGFPLGGHIHFSRVWLNAQLLRALDNYLALPLMLIEADTSIQRRPRYGFLGDFRRQPHGGFEYRTLPSWMVSPQITVGVLSLARVIADGYRALPGASAAGRLPLDDIGIQEAYYRGDKSIILPIAIQLWSDLERLPGYAEFAVDLIPLRERIVRMEPWNEAADLRLAWKIPPFDKSRAMQPEIVL